jgi:hypothetical protein
MAGDSQDESCRRRIGLEIHRPGSGKRMSYLLSQSPPKDVSPNKTSLAQLDDTEKEELRFQLV